MKRGFALALTLMLLVTQAFAANVSTTVDKTNYTVPYKDIMYQPPAWPQQMPTDVVNYATHGFGIAQVGKGIPPVKHPELLASKTAPTASGVRLTSFFTMSDIHITDVQSPAQVLVMGVNPNPGMSSAYEASIPYTAQVLAEAVATVRNYSASSPANKQEFGMMLGDAVNSAQKNELALFTKALDGGVVNPNTDPVNKYSTDFTQPFESAGLGGIPWYQIIGNHDHFWCGVYPSNAKLDKYLQGSDLMKISKVNNSKQIDGEDLYGGMIDPTQDYSQIKGAGVPNPNAPEGTYKTTANPDRAFLSDQAFMAQVGSKHAPNTSIDKDLVGCFSFTPVTDKNLPLKIIAFNDTAPQDEKFVDATAESPYQTTAANTVVTNKRFAWLKGELKKAQDNKQLVIIAMHIPTGMKGLWSKTSEVTEEQFIAEMKNYPNLLMIMSGHRHLNTVRSYEATKTTNSFWQVETASLRDYPQQFRSTKLELYPKGILGITTIDIDPTITNDDLGKMVSKARGYAMAASQIFPEPRGMVIPPSPDNSRVENVTLYKQLTPEMEKVLAKYLPKAGNKAVVGGKQ